jgi:predicted dehydrogenase/aryl-alcohol dehydrogenase-like predicted oxidoreductase
MIQMALTLAWGIIGTGNIAKAFARGVAHSKTGKLIAVGSRSQEKADAFGTEFSISRRYGSYQALLADPQVQAVYIGVPHPAHAEWAIKAARAGKHILCEKPIGMNHAEAMAIFEAAHRHDVFAMEAFMYRCHPQIAKLVELLRQKAIGDVRVIQATFSFHAGFNPESRLFKNALGGGGILDVGCYCMSLARLIAGVATGKEIAEPVDVKGVGHLGATGIDEYTVAAVNFPGDIVATLATGVGVNQENVVRIFGSEGNILMPSPWIPAREGGSVKIIVKKNKDKEPQEIAVESSDWLYGLEADTVAANIQNRQAKFPAMSWEDTLGNMRGLDLWRQSIGLVYDTEKPAGQVHTVHGGPLAVGPDATMKYGSIAGVQLPVSRLVMGCDNQMFLPHGCIMWDDYFERGGNTFDNAFVYGGGQTERNLGQWVKNRGIRKQVVILDKGAHTPNCFPDKLTEQLFVSLDRLQMDYVDIYMMHRDNLDVPVGEFVEIMNEHRRAGRMRSFGVSNWTLERIQAFNEYARTKGLTGLAAVSNNLSLARMVEAPWTGCLSSSDPQSRAFFAKTQLPLMPWSSQARGFFTDRARPEDTSDKELVRCWYADDNFRRQARAKELAAKYGVTPVTIAAAYVLCQPFPTFALIGPRQLSETRTSFGALDLQLTAQEVRWLNLEAD